MRSSSCIVSGRHRPFTWGLCRPRRWPRPKDENNCPREFAGGFLPAAPLLHCHIWNPHLCFDMNRVVIRLPEMMCTASRGHRRPAVHEVPEKSMTCEYEQTGEVRIAKGAGASRSAISESRRNYEARSEAGQIAGQKKFERRAAVSKLGFDSSRLLAANLQRFTHELHKAGVGTHRGCPSGSLASPPRGHRGVRPSPRPGPAEPLLDLREHLLDRGVVRPVPPS